jgi:hypothetical protein
MNISHYRLVTSSPRHRWYPVYPPGKPGKPHPVGCALNGDAEIEAKAEKKKGFSDHQSHTKAKCHNETHALRAKCHIYLAHTHDFQSGRRSTSIDSTQESLTGGLRCRIVAESPRFHSRKHVCRVRVLLRRRWARTHGYHRLRKRRYRGREAVTERRLSKAGVESGGLCKGRQAGVISGKRKVA